MLPGDLRRSLRRLLAASEPRDVRGVFSKVDLPSDSRNRELVASPWRHSNLGVTLAPAELAARVFHS